MPPSRSPSASVSTTTSVRRIASGSLRAAATAPGGVVWPAGSCELSGVAAVLPGSTGSLDGSGPADSSGRPDPSSPGAAVGTGPSVAPAADAAGVAGAGTGDESGLLVGFGVGRGVAPGPGVGGGAVATFVNSAAVVKSDEPRTRAQALELFPAHAPVQPANVQPLVGDAVSSRLVPPGKYELQIAPQEMPAGVLLMDPAPDVETVTIG